MTSKHRFLLLLALIAIFPLLMGANASVEYFLAQDGAAYSGKVIASGTVLNQAENSSQPVPFSLVDSNTILFIDFSNTSASGNETATTGIASWTGSDLTITQVNGIAGAVDTDGAPGAQDDGFYRDVDIGSTERWTSTQTWLKSTYGDFTIDVIVRPRTVSGVKNILATHSGGSGSGPALEQYVSGELQFFFFHSSGNTGDVRTIGTMTVDKWYHVILSRSGNVYECGFSDIASDGIITSVEDYTNIIGAHTNDFASATFTGTWEGSTNMVFSQRVGGTSTYDGDYQYLRISNTSRYR